jgi:MtaA/CmuA family methyltransferase
MTPVPEMTPRARVFASLAGDPVDRPPIINPSSAITVELMDLVDARFPDASREPELIARLASTGHTELGFDSVIPYFTLVMESAALGCKVQWEGKENWPTVVMTEPIWDRFEDVHIPGDFLEHPSIQAILRATEILRRELPDVSIIGRTNGPWTIAYNTFGVQQFLTMSADDPDTTMRILHKLKEVSVLFGEAQIAAGADILLYPDHATGDLVSGEYYKRFLMDIHAEMAGRLPVPLVLHICGYTMDRMDYIAQTGMAGFHFESKNNAQKSMDLVDGRMRMIGNVNNVTTMFARGPAEVRAEVYAGLDAGLDMIAPEGSVPLQTRLENILEIPRAVNDWMASHPDNIYARGRNGSANGTAST